MIKSIVCLVSALTLTAVAEAQTLDQMLQLNKDQAATVNSRRGLMVNQVRRGLSAKGVRVTGLQLILSTSLKQIDSRISSSFFFKGQLKGLAEDVLTEIKYGTPVVIDPTMSVTDLERIQGLKEMQFCTEKFNQRLFSPQQGSQLDELLISFIHQIVLPEKKKKKKAKSGEARRLSIEELKLVKLLNTYISKGPVNQKGQTIAAIFGNIAQPTMFNNRLRKLIFAHKDVNLYDTENLPSDQKTSLSLSMLISMRTGQDEAFVRTQRCLLNYFSEQKKLFGQRLDDLEKFRNKPTGREWAKAGISELRPDQVDLAALPKGKEGPYLLKYFYEGHPPFSDYPGEKEFLASRLAKLTQALDFLRDRVEGAIAANQKLGQLSREQMDYLIDTFIQLNQDDLPLPDQVGTLQKWARENPGRKDLQLAYNYYKQMSHDLESLQAFLAEEKEMEAARAKDLQQIRKMHP